MKTKNPESLHCSIFTLCPNPESSAKEIKLAIFGTENIDHLVAESLKLPRMPLKILDNKKVQSLQKKYITIPDNKLSYFPDPIAVLDNDSDGDEDGVVEAPPVAVLQTPAAIAKAKRPAAIPVAPGARKKPGPKPKTAMDIAVGTPSILSFYSKK